MAKEKEMQEQIRVLATNLEILNQKLNQNPDSAISPGEKVIKDSLDTMEAKVEYMQNVLKSTQMDNSIREEREALKTQVSKINSLATNLKKLDKPWLNELLEELQTMNENTTKLSENIEKMSKNTNKLLDDHRSAITKKVYSKLFKSLKKDNLIMMMFSSILSSIIALIALMGVLYFVG